MKLKLKTFMSVSVLALLMAFTPVVAIAHGADDTTDGAAQTTAAEAENTDQDSPEKLKARLEARKADLKSRLDTVKQTRLKARCKASQVKLSSISGRINGLETSRTEIYQNIQTRLKSLSEKLAAKGLDVTRLNAQIDELHNLSDTFNVELSEYKQAVADLVAMDCAADPTAFQASLEAARTARTQTADAAKAVRAYLSDTIKPTLVELRSQLEMPTETEGEQ